MSVLQLKSLGDLERESGGTIQTGPFGSQLHMSDYSDAGTPVVMPTNIRNLRIDPTGIARVTEDHVKRLARHKLRVGDIVYSRRGDVEKCALITEQEAGWLCGTGCLLVRVQGPSLDARFLAYSLAMPETRAWISQHAVGATMPNLNTEILREVPVEVPSIGLQRAIAATLGSLDDKIESNRRAAGLIEKLLRLEFRRVVSGDGVSGEALFNHVVTTKGVSYKSIDLQPSRTSLVTLKSVDRAGGYKSDGLKPYVGPYKPRQVLQAGEIVVAQTDLTQGAEVVGRAVRVPADISADTLVASLDHVIVRPLGGMPIEYLQGILTDESFRQHCRSRTSGTTVLHLSSDAIPTYIAPIVSARAQQNYSQLARPLSDRIDSLNREIGKLVAARDGLLPGLMTGRIRVPEAAEVVA
jgi:type I restriction enzyme S subunit